MPPLTLQSRLFYVPAPQVSFLTLLGQKLASRFLPTMQKDLDIAVWRQLEIACRCMPINIAIIHHGMYTVQYLRDYRTFVGCVHTLWGYPSSDLVASSSFIFTCSSFVVLSSTFYLTQEYFSCLFIIQKEISGPVLHSIVRTQHKKQALCSDRSSGIL